VLNAPNAAWAHLGPEMKETAAAPDAPCQPSAGTPDEPDLSVKQPVERKLSKHFDELLAGLSDAHRHQVQGLELELARVRRLLEGANCQAVGLSEEAELSVPGVVGEEGEGRPQQCLRHPEEFSEVVPLTFASRTLIPPGAGTSDDDSRQASKASNQSKEEWAKTLAPGVTAEFHEAAAKSASHERRQKRWAYKLVKNMYFDALSYSLITANAIFIGLSVQRQLYCSMYDLEIESWYDVIEMLFLCWFTAELSLKILAEDIHVFLGRDRMWNFLDLFLVLTSIMQVVVDRSSEATSSFPNLSLIRNVRLFRVIRILRIIRVVRVCQSLRVMIFAILRSLDALVWVLAVLFFFMYMFAMLFMYSAEKEFDDHLESCPLSECLALEEPPECTTVCARLTWLETHFGTLQRVIVTLFQSITGGLDWGEVYDIWMEIGWILGAAFIVYIYFMVFLVLNVVIGTVVDVTSGVSKRDHDSVVAEEMSKLKEYTRDIKDFFETADKDKSGQLSYDEFSKYLQEDKVKAYFRALDLDSRQAHVLFTLLDCNESGEVGYSEFLDGCLRLKGEARNLDMNLVIYQLQHLLQRMQAPAGVLTTEPGQVSPGSQESGRPALSEVIHMRSQR